MTTKTMIEILRYKADNVKAKIELEIFNEVADRLEKQVGKDTNVTSKNEWISVKDRLPEENEYPEQAYRILASCSDGLVRNATIKSLLYKKGGINPSHQPFTYIAWMPLPEPYKDGGIDET